MCAQRFPEDEGRWAPEAPAKMSSLNAKAGDKVAEGIAAAGAAAAATAAAASAAAGTVAEKAGAAVAAAAEQAKAVTDSAAAEVRMSYQLAHCTVPATLSCCALTCMFRYYVGLSVYTRS